MDNSGLVKGVGVSGVHRHPSQTFLVLIVGDNMTISDGVHLDFWGTARCLEDVGALLVGGGWGGGDRLVGAGQRNCLGAALRGEVFASVDGDLDARKVGRLDFGALGSHSSSLDDWSWSRSGNRNGWDGSALETLSLRDKGREYRIRKRFCGILN